MGAEYDLDQRGVSASRTRTAILRRSRQRLAEAVIGLADPVAITGRQLAELLVRKLTHPELSFEAELRLLLRSGRGKARQLEGAPLRPARGAGLQFALLIHSGIGGIAAGTARVVGTGPERLARNVAPRSTLYLKQTPVLRPTVEHVVKTPALVVADRALGSGAPFRDMDRVERAEPVDQCEVRDLGIAR